MNATGFISEELLFFVKVYLQVRRGFMLKLPSPVWIFELISRKVAFTAALSLDKDPYIQLHAYFIQIWPC